MRRRAKLLPLLVGAILCVGLVAALWPAADPRVEAESRGAPRSAPLAPADERVAPALGSAPADSAAAALAPSVDATSEEAAELESRADTPAAVSSAVEVRGRVFDTRRRQRAGLEVVFYVGRPGNLDGIPGPQRLETPTGEAMHRLAGGALGGSPWPLVRTQTHADGSFSILVPRRVNSLLAEQRLEVKLVAGDPEDPLSLACVGNRLAWEPLDVYDFGTVRLRRSSTLRVVVRSSGAPLHEAKVTLSGRGENGMRPVYLEATTDADGVATVAYRQLEEAKLRVESSGHASWSKPLGGRPVTQLTVELVAETQLRGTVSNEAGEPLAGIRVRALPVEAALEQGHAEVRGQTDERGAFLLTGLAPGIGYTVATWETGGDYLECTQPLAPPLSDVHLTLERAGRLGLTLVAEEDDFDFELLDFVVERLDPDGTWGREFSFANRVGHARLTGEEDPSTQPGRRYVEYRWSEPGDYRIRGFGGTLRAPLRLTVRAGETAKGTLQLAKQRHVRVEFAQLDWVAFVDVAYPLEPEPWSETLTIEEGVLVFHPPPEARECVIKTWEHEPLRVALPPGVSDLGTLELVPEESEEADDW